MMQRQAARRARRRRRGAAADRGRPRRMRGALQEGARLRAHRRAARRDPGRSRRSSRCATDASWPTRRASTSGRWPTASPRPTRTCRRCCSARRRRSDEPIAFLVPLAVEPFPLGPRAGAARGQADEPDGARRVPGAPRRLVPLSDLLATHRSHPRRLRFSATTIWCSATPAKAGGRRRTSCIGAGGVRRAEAASRRVGSPT